METTDKENVVPPENGSATQESSADKTWDSEKYDAYQKSLPKKYWGHEALKDIHSMEEMAERVVNPIKKAPERYEGISEELADVCDALRDADVGQDDAKRIADAFSRHMPKRYSEESLKEIYGADWEKAESDFGKAVEKIFDNEDERNAFRELKCNPALFKFASIVGRNLGDSPNLGIGRPQVTPSKTGDVITDLLTGKL